MIASPRQIVVGLCALTLAGGISACGETASTSNFKGEGHNVAQTVSNFENDATALDQQKVCEDDLATVLRARLRDAGGCQAVLKNQLRAIDALTLSIESIAVNGTKARARVKSTYSGKSRVTTLLLVKEGSKWKVSGVQS
jgi:hypothetical protein